MKVYDQEGLDRALSELQGPGVVQLSQSDLHKIRRRRRGLILSFAGVSWSVVVLVATCFFGPPLPRRYVLPMPFLAFGALAYVLAAHSDGFSMASFAEQLRAGAKFWSEVGRTLQRMPRWAILLCLAGMFSPVILQATGPPRPEGYAVQDQRGYWLEDKGGGKIRPMTEEEFRNFGVDSDRPLAFISLDLSLLAALGFAYGPGCRPRRRDDAASGV
jgi:hypothetical protein